MSANAVTIDGLQVGELTWLEVLHGWLTTVDHKRIGILYVVYALFFIVVGGVEALIIRIQLMYPHNNFVSPQVFNRLFTMHGTTMIFFVAIPIMFGFANYLVPLMIGARDMAFPRLNAFSFWLTALSGFLLYFSLLGGNGLYGAGNAPDISWWAYAPLAAKAFSPGHSSDYWTLAVFGMRQPVADPSRPAKLVLLHRGLSFEPWIFLLRSPVRASQNQRGGAGAPCGIHHLSSNTVPIDGRSQGLAVIRSAIRNYVLDMETQATSSDVSARLER